MIAMPATVVKSDVKIRRASPQDRPQHGLIKRHMLMSLTFVPAVQGREPETESEDRDENQHPEAS